MQNPTSPLSATRSPGRDAVEAEAAGPEPGSDGRAAVAGTVPRRAPRGMAPRRRGADHYDTILWRVRPRGGDALDGYTIGVTGCARKAGVSTVAANLAIRAADHRQSPVLLIDANLEHPSIGRSFRLHGAPGLTELLAETCQLQEAIHESGVEGLSVMPLGQPGLVDRARVDFECFASLLGELRSDFATIVVDLPESGRMRHSLLIAQQADAVLLVLRADATRRAAAKAAAARFGEDGVNIVGTVVTQQKNYVPRWFQRWT